MGAGRHSRARRGELSWERAAEPTDALYRAAAGGSDDVTAARDRTSGCRSGLIVYTHVGYPLLLRALARIRGAGTRSPSTAASSRA